MREREGEGGRMRERERDRGEERGGQRRGRSPLDPESANSNITIRPPGSERRRTLRLPPSSYVLSLSLSSASLSFFLSFSLSLASHSFLPPCTRFVPSRSPPPVFDPTPRPNTNQPPPPPPLLHFSFTVALPF